MNKYAFTLSRKTRVLNFFRRIFTIQPFETMLAYLSNGRQPDSFIGKFVPPSYLFPSGSIRKVFRNNSHWQLDVHDMIDHYVYFGLAETSRDVLYKLIKPGYTLIDVGANIGETTLMFSQLVGESGKVIAFEPDPFTFKKLAKNISLNDAGNVQLVECALGNQNKNANLYTVFEVNRGMNRLLETAENNYKSTQVKIVTLDEFVLEGKIDKVDFIMLDAEGYELNVLKGAQQTIKKFNPTLFIELDNENLKEQNTTAAELILFLNSLDYKVTNAVNGNKISHNDDFSNCHYDIIAVRR